MAAACEWHPQVAKASVTSLKIQTPLLIQPDRYRLVWGKFCPWATQIAIEIDLLGLDKAISKGEIQSLRRSGLDVDWVFGATDQIKDPVLQTARLSENYRQAQPEFTGRATVPALVDVTTGAVVNNDANFLMDQFATAWRPYFSPQAPELYPTAQAETIQRISKIILHEVNEVPGEILQAKTQAEYEQLAQIFFTRLAEFDQTLAHRSYLLGEQLTQPDIRLFVTLVRFDLVYYYQNKLSYKKLTDFPALWAYAKRLYQLPAFKKNTDFAAIQAHFYQINDTPVTSFERVTPFGINVAKWTQV
ncbi:glutathione S-transferase C-terminal domain-containing protein [Loigolactobacillus zhaoyuanensis]|uniref:glutathione S-transferase C-terminal domain-containing protein n=1 Tax=Loigolactobacillus zhaoyuanensis TaxID=2486017 RepID=UPI000F738B48|nr:glutathione S-transferase C-terminal domain-containing protein [Loigolactobacillus zhaoyuanensis]